MTKTIICFGDSNTYGLQPSPLPWTRQRFGTSQRWPTILAQMTGCDVISEGLPGRTASSVNTGNPHLDALPFVPAMMESHTPVDTVVVMLGTNDLQASLGLSPEQITIALAAVAKSIRRAERTAGTVEPKILIIAPPSVVEVGFRRSTFGNASAKSKALPPLYADMAESLGFSFVDANAHVKVSDVDGIHLDEPNNAMLAVALAATLRAA